MTDPAEYPKVMISPTDWKVLGQVRLGRSNKEIAAELCIGVNNVEHRMSKLLLRFGVRTRTQLAMKIERLGWYPGGGDDSSEDDTTAEHDE